MNLLLKLGKFNNFIDLNIFLVVDIGNGICSFIVKNVNLVSDNVIDFLVRVFFKGSIWIWVLVGVYRLLSVVIFMMLLVGNNMLLINIFSGVSNCGVLFRCCNV